MISVLHKLYPTKKQESFLNDCLFSAVGIENWAIGQIKNAVIDYGIRRIPLGAHKPTQIRSILSKQIEGHSKKSGLPSRLIGDCISSVCEDLTKLNKRGLSIHRMHFKNSRKKRSFRFTGDMKIDPKGRLKLPGLKTSLRMSEQDKFTGKLKRVQLIKKFDGWWACCVYDQATRELRSNSDKEIGIDPGLSTGLTCSDGTKIQFPRFLRDKQELLKKQQRKSKNSKKHKFTHRRITNARLNHHHQVSTCLVLTYAKIYWSNDDFSELKRLMGRSYSDQAPGLMRQLIKQKSASKPDGFVLVESRNSTKTCSACGALTGPSGRAGLSVRHWVCSCGTEHDRDINAAINTHLSGRGPAANKWKNNKSQSVRAA